MSVAEESIIPREVRVEYVVQSCFQALVINEFRMSLQRRVVKNLPGGSTPPVADRRIPQLYSALEGWPGMCPLCGRKWGCISALRSATPSRPAGINPMETGTPPNQRPSPARDYRARRWQLLRDPKGTSRLWAHGKPFKFSWQLVMQTAIARYRPSSLA